MAIIFIAFTPQPIINSDLFEMLQILRPDIDHILSKKLNICMKVVVVILELQMKPQHHLAPEWRIKVGVNAFLDFKDFNMIFLSCYTPRLYRLDLYCLEKCDRYKRRPGIKIDYSFIFWLAERLGKKSSSGKLR